VQGVPRLLDNSYHVYMAEGCDCVGVKPLELGICHLRRRYTASNNSSSSRGRSRGSSSRNNHEVTPRHLKV